MPGIVVGTNGKGAIVFRGFDGGSFQQQTAIPGGFVVSVDMNYFNADTIPDIVVPSYWGGSFTIYLGASDGSFAPGETYLVEGHCTQVVTGDFNEDGKVDIAASHNGSGQPLNLYVYLGNGDGTFSRFQKYPTQLATPTQIIAADVNNDKHTDIAYSLSDPGSGVLFLGKGDGTFKEPMLIAAVDTTSANGDSRGFSLADINFDGNLDWIDAQDFLDSIIVRLGDGKGKFSQDTSLYFPGAFDVETADINGDGTIDIIASNLDSVVCFLQDQQGTFSPSATIHSAHGLVNLLAQDIDKDGFPDLIISNLDSAFSVAINQGSLSAGVDRHDPYPSVAALFQNYPNPFNPTTVVSFQLSAVSDVELTVYDVLGREVAVLINARKTPGNYDIRFDGSNLASGVYYCRLMARHTDKGQERAFVQTRNLLLLK
jgi:hypothetical protein